MVACSGGSSLRVDETVECNPPSLILFVKELSARPRFLGDTTLEGSATPAPSSRLAAQSTDDHAPDKQTDNETDEEFAARWSIDVGEVGDSNLCCAAAALALTPRLLARAAPPHSFRQGYTGAFRFQFWVWGSWRWVTVDDRLPTRRGRLITSRSALPHDYTLPLLEKAYAKLYGSYMSLREGSCARALQDLCGGVVQSFAPPRQSPALLLRVLNSAVPRATLLVLTPQQEKGISGSRMRNGLIPGQPYCVTGLARVRGEAGLARSVAGEGAEGEECAGALSPATYSVESMVLLNDVSRQDKEVGYKIAGSLDVQPVWGIDSDFLLKFTLNSPKLLARGKLVTADYLPIKSIWDPYYKTEFYAHWKNGIITDAYLNPDEVTDILNYKKSLISLFQLQIIDGEHNEIDVSGDCSVLYDSISMQVIRKIKTKCKHPNMKDSTEGITSRRLTRYTLSEKLDAIDEVHAEELHTAGYKELNAAIKARVWMRLRRDGVPRTTATKYPDLETALAELPSNLKPVALPMLMTDDILDDELSLEEAINGAVVEGEEEEAGGGGSARAAQAGLRALRALRNATQDRIAALLRAQPDARSLTALCRVLGAAGNAHAHVAVSLELPLAERDAPPPATEYLHALALADTPDVLVDVLRLGTEARSEVVREAALLAAAAGAARLANHAPHVAETVRDALSKQLARCLAQLLGHVWSGTGSTPTPVLRALQPLGTRSSTLPLLAAGVLHVHCDSAIALALDAQAQVSLWSRTALSELELRVGAAGGVRGELRLVGGALRAHAHHTAEPRLRVAAHLDFYDRMALCVKVSTEDHVRRLATFSY
ncbi:Calpain-9 [Papilio machaon]|uniref:Calpain-9 n=1 Tax=Papilio machaon TaxID=76193 RepID=A0A194R555_PAPMA|nr:Calpain-9 [Papilio machaon]